MFEVGDIVLYNQTHICRVAGIETRLFLGRERIQYYVLKPANSEETAAKSTLYVPVDADESRIRRAFSAEELTIMLSSGGAEIVWQENAILRKKSFQEILNGGDPAQLLGLIRTLTLRRIERMQHGRSLSDTEEKFLSSAEKQLYPLFHSVLGMGWSEFQNRAEGKQELAALLP